MYVDLGLQNGGFPINVSEGGMAFHGVVPMQKDQLIHVKFKLPGQSNSVESAAQIAWLNALQKGGGLRFIDLPENTRRLIKEWLSLQTSVRGLADSASIPRAAVETDNSKATPAIRLVANQDRFSAKTASSAVAATLDSPLSPVGAANAITAGTPISRALFASLVIAAILGVISLQFHWGSQLPTIDENRAQPVSESVTPEAPGFSSIVQTADAPPSNPTGSQPAVSLAAGPAHSPIDTGASSQGSDTTEATAPMSRRTKMAIPLKIKPSLSSFHQIEMNAKPVTPSRMVKSPVADINPPSLVPSIKPESAPQLPVLFMEMPPPAPSPSVSARQIGKFDAPRIVVRKNPVYPIHAREDGLSGSVELQFTIGADGHVRDVIVVKGNPILAGAAVQAVQDWRYQPARRDGVAVESESSVIFAFKSN